MGGIGVGKPAVVLFVGLRPGGPARLGVMLTSSRASSLVECFVLVRQFAEQVGPALDDGVDGGWKWLERRAGRWCFSVSAIFLPIRLGLLA